jgi:16S rRNA (cytosine967-C5)-methyltransferase
MTPGARAEAAILLLQSIEAGSAAADDVLNSYFRRHRFAGAKDRAAIAELVYGVLRKRASLDWWIARAGLPADARHRVIAALMLMSEWTIERLGREFDGDRFRPAPLSPPERQFAAALEGKSLLDRAMPGPARGNYPAWLEPYLEAGLKAGLAREMAAAEQEAPLDLRVNRLKTDREAVRAALARLDIEAARTRLSPLGLRLFERVPLGTLELFKKGQIEVQDEGSQIASLLVDARPGMRVVDFCAGAGGKTLALAAAMENRGHLVACDVSAQRLERAAERLRRAGAEIVQRKLLSGARDKWVKRHAQSFDRVLIDAPCTGTGTWRRNPDAKWRLAPEGLAELVERQAEILDSAARLVRPGGRLVYVTCSLLVEENEAQIERFLAAHPEFAVLPVGRVWAEAVGGDCPTRGDMLRLTPARHGTDGFFIAILERAALASGGSPPNDKAP